MNNLYDVLYNSKIMIIDDNELNVKLMTKILNSNGYENLVTLTDSRKAMDIILEEKPLLILLDLQMPFVSGIEILKELQKVNYKYPVIVITAQNDNEYRIESLKLGANDFVTKPFQNAEVTLRIRNSLHNAILSKKLEEENILLEEKVRQRTEEIRNTQLEMIERLSMAVEFKDENTGLHIKRIGRTSRILAEMLNLSKTFCEDIEYASMLHDVGKIVVEDDILNSKSLLSLEQRETMKKHTVYGARVLDGSSSKLLNMAKDIAETHHERWDGQGYPNGLKGEEIPLAGRITAICDVFDALLTVRPYKKAWPIEVVIDTLKSERGKHFDPDITDTFLENIDVFLAMIEEK